MALDTAFQFAASNIRYGSGCTSEVGFDLQDLRVKRALVVIDPALVNLPVGTTVREALDAAGIEHVFFDQVVVEPTDASFQAAAKFATEGKFDGYLAVGGGSTIDTAKAANLYATYPADFLDYVNPSIGRGKPIPGPLKPLIAIPTTAGTGSETTGVAIFDYTVQQVKTGISHRFLRPTLGIIDPDNTRTQPAAVAASAGLDVLSHALESYTAIPYTARQKPNKPSERTAYQGTNPISDVWSLRALEMVAEFLPRAVADITDDEARGQMLLASGFAGIGFGNAGVHLPHAMAYPVAGMVRDFRPAGYATTEPLIPHGMSVILNTPAVVRFTASACPERHLRAAQALGVDVAGKRLEDAGKILADRIIYFMQLLHMPRGLKAVGYSEADIPNMILGTLPQSRITKLSPRPAGEAELGELFRDSMQLW
ncbi:MAG: mdh 2 [Planctomycetaceae bacterium]|nr:mdh 2 [Planctomycetaceae bacterium]